MAALLDRHRSLPKQQVRDILVLRAISLILFLDSCLFLASLRTLYHISTTASFVLSFLLQTNLSISFVSFQRASTFNHCIPNFLRLVSFPWLIRYHVQICTLGRSHLADNSSCCLRLHAVYHVTSHSTHKKLNHRRLDWVDNIRKKGVDHETSKGDWCLPNGRDNGPPHAMRAFDSIKVC